MNTSSSSHDYPLRPRLHDYTKVIANPENKNKRLTTYQELVEPAPNNFLEHTLAFLFGNSRKQELTDLRTVLRENFGACYEAQAISPEQIKQLETPKSLVKRGLAPVIEEVMSTVGGVVNRQVSGTKIALTFPENAHEEEAHQDEKTLLQSMPSLGIGSTVKNITKTALKNSVPTLNATLGKMVLGVSLPEVIQPDSSDIHYDMVHQLFSEGNTFLNTHISHIDAAEEGKKNLTAKLDQLLKGHPGECVRFFKNETPETARTSTDQENTIAKIKAHATQVQATLDPLPALAPITKPSLEKNELNQLITATADAMGQALEGTILLHDQMSRLKTAITTTLETPAPELGHTEVEHIKAKLVEIDAASEESNTQLKSDFQDTLRIFDELTALNIKIVSPEETSGETPQSLQTALTALQSGLEERLTSLEQTRTAVNKNLTSLISIKKQLRITDSEISEQTANKLWENLAKTANTQKTVSRATGIFTRKIRERAALLPEMLEQEETASAETVPEQPIVATETNPLEEEEDVWNEVGSQADETEKRSESPTGDLIS